MTNDVIIGYYKDGIENVKSDLENIKKNYLKLGYHLKQIKDCGWYKYKYQTDCFDKYCKDEFGLSKSNVMRLIQIIDKFCLPDNYELKEKYVGFNQSQLIEMLPLGEYDIQYVHPDMTIKEIRQLKSYDQVVDVIPGQQNIIDMIDTVETVSHNFVATSQQVELKPCLQSAGFDCNMSNHHDVALLQGIDCPRVCCWDCKFDLCGARCNISSHNKLVPELSYVEQRKIDLTKLYHCTRQEFNKYDCIPEKGKKKKFKFGPYEMTIEHKGDNADV